MSALTIADQQALLAALPAIYAALRPIGEVTTLQEGDWHIAGLETPDGGRLSIVVNITE